MELFGTKLNDTHQADVYYIDFNNIPEKIQGKLLKSIVVERNRHTLFEGIAYLKTSIDINGDDIEFELSLGKVEKDTDLVDGIKDDSSWNDRANELLECVIEDIGYQSVYIRY